MVLVQILPVYLLAPFRTVADPLAGAASFQVRLVRETTNAQPTTYGQERNIRDTDGIAAWALIQQLFTDGIVRLQADLPFLNSG